MDELVTEKERDIKGSAYDELKLYGIALAGISVDGDPNIIDVSCVPLSVSHKDRDNFEMVENLRFNARFDLANAQSVFDCFVKIIDSFDQVVTLQTQALAKYSLPYRPVALNIGDDSSRPVDINVLYPILFRACKVEIGIPSAKKSRDDFSAQHPKGYGPYMEACKKLAQLSGKFSLKWNSFTRATWEGNDLQPVKMDRLLLQLKRALDRGNERAHDLMCAISEHQGKSFGEVFTECQETSGKFVANGPPGYRTDKAMQDTLPHYGAYLYWHPDFRESFLHGFKTAFKGRFSNSIRLALDPPSPPFADPCSDRVRDQLQIIDGDRSPENIIDASEWRQTIAADSWLESRPSLKEYVRLITQRVNEKATRAVRRARAPRHIRAFG